MSPRRYANGASREGADVEDQHRLRAPRNPHRIELYLLGPRAGAPHPEAIGGHRHQVRPHPTYHGLRTPLELRAQGGRPSSARVADARRRSEARIHRMHHRRQQHHAQHAQQHESHATTVPVRRHHRAGARCWLVRRELDDAERTWELHCKGSLRRRGRQSTVVRGHGAA